MVGVVGVVFFFGIGKLLVVFILGRLFDKFGRKLFVIFGVFFYIIFLGGILFSFNMIIVYMFGIFVGIVNFFLDIGIYFVFMEVYLKKVVFVNIIVKVFV